VARLPPLGEPRPTSSCLSLGKDSPLPNVFLGCSPRFPQVFSPLALCDKSNWLSTSTLFFFPRPPFPPDRTPSRLFPKTFSFGFPPILQISFPHTPPAVTDPKLRTVLSFLPGRFLPPPLRSFYNFNSEGSSHPFLHCGSFFG